MRAREVEGSGGARRLFRGRRKPETEVVDWAAWLNVLLLTGMFALGGAKFVLQPGVRLTLPEGPFLDGAGYGAQTVTVAGNGRIFYRDGWVDEGTLEQALEGWEGGTLLVEADEGTDYGRLMDLYAAATRAGVEEVVLATRPPLAAPAGEGER